MELGVQKSLNRVRNVQMETKTALLEILKSLTIKIRTTSSFSCSLWNRNGF